MESFTYFIGILMVFVITVDAQSGPKNRTINLVELKDLYEACPDCAYQTYELFNLTGWPTPEEFAKLNLKRPQMLKLIEDFSVCFFDECAHKLVSELKNVTHLYEKECNQESESGEWGSGTESYESGEWGSGTDSYESGEWSHSRESSNSNEDYGSGTEEFSF